MIKLNLEVETPMSDDDRDILAGISVMMLAVANRQNLAQQQMEMEPEEGPEEEPEACGAVEAGSGGASTCTKEAGHSGRHKYRTLTWTAVN